MHVVLAQLHLHGSAVFVHLVIYIERAIQKKRLLVRAFLMEELIFLM
jgi:hypothetical protein